MTEIPPLAANEIRRLSPTKLLLQPPVEPLLRYTSTKSLVSASKKAVQCREPHPVISLRFNPITLSCACFISPRFSEGMHLFSNIFLYVSLKSSGI